ncbi:MAG: hypothetical protein P1U56_00950 [Saprospiraceae bacterium]|nr:hypothetical protein [Saprospiraceae bacterium]
MNKIFTVFAFVLCMACTSYAQSSEEGFSRKGRFLVETGYNIVGGISNSSGANIQWDFDGGSITALGADVGKMLSENFAIKFRLGLLSANGFSITNVTAGVKYYAGGVVPIELTAGMLDGGPGSSTFTANLKLGYAARLADNITLEPTIGMLILEEEGALNFGISFGLFL